MERIRIYYGGLTAEQFLFREIRTVAKLYLAKKGMTEAIDEIKANNLFQYPTEREVSRIARACYKRLEALDNDMLRQELAYGPSPVAKQINLYAMMRYNALIWDFMLQVIGEKFQDQDFSFSRKDLHAFFARLQEQNDRVAAWSAGTVQKIKSVLVRSLMETEYLDSMQANTLNRVILSPELEQGIRANGDEDALPAFHCLK